MGQKPLCSSPTFRPCPPPRPLGSPKQSGGVGRCFSLSLPLQPEPIFSYTPYYALISTPTYPITFPRLDWRFRQDTGQLLSPHKALSSARRWRVPDKHHARSPSAGLVQQGCHSYLSPILRGHRSPLEHGAGLHEVGDRNKRQIAARF